MPAHPIQESDMRACLRASYGSDSEANALWVTTQAIKDPGSPPDQNGRRRLHPLLIIFGALIALVAGTFLYFSLS